MEIDHQFNGINLAHNLIAQKNSLTGATVYYVAAYKQSESGLMFNPRLLLLQTQNFSIFYTKHFKPAHQLLEMQKKALIPIKLKLLVVNTTAEIQDSTITISFVQEKIKKNWVFRFSNEKLTIKWFILYKELQNRHIVKALNPNCRKSASNSLNNSQFSSILSHSRYYQSVNPYNKLISVENKIESYSQPKKLKRQESLEKQVALQKQEKGGRISMKKDK